MRAILVLLIGVPLAWVLFAYVCELFDPYPEDDQ